MISESLITLKPMVVSVMMIIAGLISLHMYRKQLLISLLSLETSTLGVFMTLALTLGLMGEPISISFYLLVFGACEASLGLVILVMMTRLSGSDMVVSLSNMKC